MMEIEREKAGEREEREGEVERWRGRERGGKGGRGRKGETYPVRA